MSIIAMSQYLFRLLSLCWITDGYSIYLPIGGMLPWTGIKLTPFQNYASNVAGLQLYVTAPGLIIQRKLFVSFIKLVPEGFFTII